MNAHEPGITTEIYDPLQEWQIYRVVALYFVEAISPLAIEAPRLLHISTVRNALWACLLVNIPAFCVREPKYEVPLLGHADVFTLWHKEYDTWRRRRPQARTTNIRSAVEIDGEFRVEPHLWPYLRAGITIIRPTSLKSIREKNATSFEEFLEESPEIRVFTYVIAHLLSILNRHKRPTSP